MKKYKDRYVLAEGWPVSDDPLDKIYTLRMGTAGESYSEVKLKIPEYMLCDFQMPKYRLVLERIK